MFFKSYGSLVRTIEENDGFIVRTIYHENGQNRAIIFNFELKHYSSLLKQL